EDSLVDGSPSGEMGDREVREVADAGVMVDAGPGIDDDVRTDLRSGLDYGARADHRACAQGHPGVHPGEGMNDRNPFEIHLLCEGLANVIVADADDGRATIGGQIPDWSEHGNALED